MWASGASAHSATRDLAPPGEPPQVTRFPDKAASSGRPADARLLQLLDEWQRLIDQGREVAPKELCRDCPELLEAFLQEIHTISLLPPKQGEGPAQHTVHWLPAARATGLGPEAAPAQIGRYRVSHVLGQGGFGVVYLAYDEQLQRQVAIKAPHPRMLRSREDIDAYLTEARTVAALDHPNIVPVYDAGASESCPFFVVSKFIEGSTLRKKIHEESTSAAEAVLLTAVIAETLQYAHGQGLVHRDIKPSNILLDLSNKPYVADFGIALKEENVGCGPRHAGTLPYMSPEQARGEGHRVDGRSDIYSLGIVFYEQLTGRRPFHGQSSNELLEQIAGKEPRPPRQWDGNIPKELERICLRALMKRASERYSTAGDMAEDLRHYLKHATDEAKVIRHVSSTSDAATASGTNSSVDSGSTPSADRGPLPIIPKGLRSFDEDDADFFLGLMPGPRDRAGLPDSIRFWKNAIECLDPDRTFAVGLIYGPSGCGKSSLVKAGLLPRLAKNVTVLYIEATADETEKRLLAGLRNQFPELGAQLGLKETLAALRQRIGRAGGGKVLIVFDQFEQWLHAKQEETNTELVHALRQCDGAHVQALVMVRDDFWLALTRFLGELEIDLVQRKNAAVVDLFDIDHAHKVLTALGQAFGKLPEGPGALSKDQKEFLHKAVQGLAHDGKVTCIHLALFAEMIKSKPWTTATLKAVGGMQGVGVNFLEETFSSAASNPKHRLHRRAACAVLAALLPDSGADIKGNMRSHAELLAASGYAGRPKDFADLINILDRQTGLITPTAPEGAGPEDITPVNFQPGERYYQLTHDYLVHSLRDWLARSQKQSWRGRTRLLLAEQAALWNSKPQHRYLPSTVEWASILLLTRRGAWSSPQQRMMNRADRYHVVRLLGLAAMVFLLAWGAWEYQGRMKARALTASLLRPGMGGVTTILDDMAGYRRWGESLLLEAYNQAQEQNDLEKLLKLKLARLRWDPAQAEDVYDRLLDAKAQDFSVVRAELGPYKQEFIERLWTKLEDKTADPDQRFRAACALAGYAPDDGRWAAQGPFLVNKLATADALALKDWKSALEFVGVHLLPAAGIGSRRKWRGCQSATQNVRAVRRFLCRQARGIYSPRKSLFSTVKRGKGHRFSPAYSERRCRSDWLAAWYESLASPDPSRRSDRAQLSDRASWNAVR